MILICDDDAAIRSSLGLVLSRAGYDTAAVASPKEAIDFVRNNDPKVILMDMNYSRETDGEEGLVLLKQVKIFKPDIPVILITAWGTISLAVKGMQAGAFDFITKPWNNHFLISTIQTAIDISKPENTSSQLLNSYYSEKIIGRSPLLLNIFKTVDRIAPTNASVLIMGESGTGKELIAEAIHAKSSRADKPFVKVNLGGISQSLFESEMFGHKKGAFTDALYDRVGRFEKANEGTIFLDEIGELDLVSQVKMLRVLQDQTFEALGDSKTRQVDVRVISATNRDLVTQVTEGRFREDLFYRINLITLKMPTLRERKEDIPLLVDFFAEKQRKLVNSGKLSFTKEAIRFLQSLPFPGNIRELKNLIDRTLLVSSNDVITEEDLLEQSMITPNLQVVADQSVYPLEEMEIKMIKNAMELYQGNLSKVANVLGVSRQALYRRLDKYNINYNEKER
ncbi:sigma-54 dependent transcriptional regulator [Bacteroidales bacterium OttesenSCG-928-B11]|nr:sigma-54 dependent transcriptional regulator [Bacteroidales bacterium OttesenSCG-928-B11]MDL2325451.1 sigma-54 dependent transcriptional regulator [Bacteroidales bacterium OttesenSCG-928-A14]